MLVATRDPMHGHGPHDGAPSPRPTASHATRFVAAMQIFGSVMAIPVGLGTAYSLYRTNFSVDTTCQALRANIISMIDKKIDATARRMLVRHDVETFEKTCGGVDPDAEAAFKTLLAAEPPARAVPAKAEILKRVEAPKAEAKIEPKVEAKIDPKPEQAKDVHKPDLRAAVPAETVKERKEAVREPAKEAPKEIAKEPVKAAAVEAPAQQADARWLDAVRGALVAHEAKAATAEAASDAAAARGAPPHHLALPPPPVAAAPVATAPALPPPTQVSDPVRASDTASADPDRPVPPASIPDETGPKPTGWISHVPFVGQVLAK